MMNGVSGPDSEDYNHWPERKPAQSKPLSPPQPQKLSDSYSNTLPVRKNVQPKNSYAASKNCPLSSNSHASGHAAHLALGGHSPATGSVGTSSCQGQYGARRARLATKGHGSLGGSCLLSGSFRVKFISN